MDYLMLPNLVLIGAMKSGTTSLHYYLGLHPEISMSKPKEIDFFSIDNNWKKGIKWYESHFNKSTKVRGEASTSYTKHPEFPNVPERMYSIIPNAKLIYLLRDPVERIISHYIQNYSAGREKRTFNKAMNIINQNHYVNCSKYFYQLEQYLKYYNSSNIMIIPSYNLKYQRRRTLKKIFKALKVDEAFYCPEYSNVLHKSVDKKRENVFGLILKYLYPRLPVKVKNIIKKGLPDIVINNHKAFTKVSIQQPELDENLKMDITNCIMDDILKLRKFTGIKFSDWCL